MADKVIHITVTLYDYVSKDEAEKMLNRIENMIIPKHINSYWQIVKSVSSYTEMLKDQDTS